MAKARLPKPVKLFVGLLSNDADLLRRTKHLLQRKYGPVDVESEMWPFTQTDYYEAEMGPGLLRWFLAFERLIRQDQLAEIKLETNKLEQQITEEALSEYGRAVNIDPGYLGLGKIVLATAKDRSHRIYLAHGIYAETTLHYVEGHWRLWPWTYLDYQTPHYHAYFDAVRERFDVQRRQMDEMLSAPEERPE